MVVLTNKDVNILLCVYKIPSANCRSLVRLTARLIIFTEINLLFDNRNKGKYRMTVSFIFAQFSLIFTIAKSFVGELYDIT